jgi:16S rRNA (cytidine1402-2'-O)-methyltransferase
MSERPILYLIPNTLGDSSFESVMPTELAPTIRNLKYFIVENIRNARRYLSKIGEIVIDDLTFYKLNKHTQKEEMSSFLEPLKNGNSMGIISEAGLPGIADPGADIVALAHQKKYTVKPLVGPSSILLALIASGMNGQSFVFHGYLPIKPHERVKKLKQIEATSEREHQSQIFMETPYRNQKFLADILQNCNQHTKLCIATDITLESEFIETKTIGEWKKRTPNIQKRPTIFVLQKGN